VPNVSPTEGDAGPEDGRDGAVRSDGGEALDVFSRTSDVPAPSRRERLSRRFDAYVYAPMMVAWNDWRTRVGFVILVAFTLMGTVLPKIVPQTSPMAGTPFTPPAPFHDGWFQVGQATAFGVSVPWPEFHMLLGTDVVGRDLWRLMVHSTWPLIEMILAGAILSIIIAMFVGTISGYKGGTIDGILMTITDIVLTVPGLALIMVLAAIFTPREPWMVGILLGIDNWPGLSRTIRSQVLSLREESHVEVSRTMGLSKFTIVRKDLLSQLMPYVSINLAGSARNIIFESVGLYFIGILPYSVLNWGVIMNLAYNRADLRDLGEVHYLLIPSLAIIVVSLGFVLFAQGLDRVFNVRLRAKHARTVGEEEEESGALSIED
jgi:peptide/nickel transport system permease protein